MIITRTPFRLSLLGGGTDYKEWYLKHGGEVLGGAIDKYCYLTLRALPPFFEHKYRVVYGRVETTSSVAEIEHPVVRAVFEMHGLDQGMELHHDGDLPARSGIGSSAAFAVGICHAVRHFLGKDCDPWTLASEAIVVEHEILKETGGVQDQITCSIGGVNHFKFHKNGEITCERSLRLARNVGELESWLVLLYSGVQRSSHEVSQPLLESVTNRHVALERTRQMVEEGRKLLESGGEKNLRGFGELLNESWYLKREVNPLAVSAHVEELYDEALQAGAIGGKISGAGGGGFLLFAVPPHRRRNFLEVMGSRSLHVPFRFVNNGSEVVLASSDLGPNQATEGGN